MEKMEIKLVINVAKNTKMNREGARSEIERLFFVDILVVIKMIFVAVSLKYEVVFRESVK